MSIDECRIKEFFLFYLLKIAERSDIYNSSIDNNHSSFDKVSYEMSEIMESWHLKPDTRNLNTTGQRSRPHHPYEIDENRAVWPQVFTNP